MPNVCVNDKWKSLFKKTWASNAKKIKNFKHTLAMSALSLFCQFMKDFLDAWVENLFVYVFKQI